MYVEVAQTLLLYSYSTLCPKHECGQAMDCAVETLDVCFVELIPGLWRTIKRLLISLNTVQRCKNWVYRCNLHFQNTTNSHIGCSSALLHIFK